MPTASQNDSFLLRELLRDVSRSFYLTLRVLPGPVRAPIGLAYLLARATDTIADTAAVPIEHRLATLRQLQERILGKDGGPFDLGPLQDGQASAAERALLARLPECLQLLGRTETRDQALIRQVLETITSGQELDLLRFGRASESGIASLKSASELDDYTYRVAGCVGEFWTRICVSHLTPQPRPDLATLTRLGIRFGQGLQLVNVLRDLPADLRLGRCYLPLDELEAAGLRPSDLLIPANWERARPIHNRWLARAREHLEAAWEYVCVLPYSWFRVRLACSWPVLIGTGTLARLAGENFLNPEVKIKVPRAEVRSILRRTVLLYPFPRLWRKLPCGVFRQGPVIPP